MKIIKTSFLFTMLFLSFSTFVLGQNKKIDSLKIELQNHKEADTIRVNLLNELAFSLKKIDTILAEVYLEKSAKILEVLNYPKGKAKNILINGIIIASKTKYEKGFPLYEESLQLNKDIGFDKGISECYKEMGHLHYYRGKQQQAISYYKMALTISKQIDDNEEIFDILSNIGWSYILLGKYNEAEAIYKEALLNSEGIKNKTVLSGCYSDLGIIYSYQGNYTMSLGYYNKSLLIAQKYQDSAAIGNALANMATIYTNLKDYDKTIETLKESTNFLKKNYKNATASNYNNIGLAYSSQKKYKNALKYLNDARKIYIERSDKTGEATTLINIAEVCIGLKDYDTAYTYFEQAKKLGLSVANQRVVCYSYLGLAKILAIQKQYNNALNQVLKSKEIADNLKLVNLQRDGSQLLSEVYNHIGNYKKAFSSHKEFKILNDSLFNKENIEKITQLEYEYKYKRQIDSASIRELKLTEQVTATSRDLEKSKQNYLWAIIGFLFISMLLGSVIFFQKFRTVKAQNQTIATEQKLLRSQMTPHFIFNSLSVLQGMILNKESKKSISYLSKFSKLLRITLENSRDKTVLLSEELIAIRNYLELQNLESNAYQFSLVVEENIDVSMFEIPPMLIQPFVENAVEHGFVGRDDNRTIDIHLTYTNKRLICTIEDDGIGYESQMNTKTKHKKSLSTAITAERLKILSKDFNMKGYVTIEDRKHYKLQGTIVTLVIPHILVS